MNLNGSTCLFQGHGFIQTTLLKQGAKECIHPSILKGVVSNHFFAWLKTFFHNGAKSFFSFCEFLFPDKQERVINMVFVLKLNEEIQQWKNFSEFCGLILLWSFFYISLIRGRKNNLNLAFSNDFLWFSCILECRMLNKQIFKALGWLIGLLFIMTYLIILVLVNILWNKVETIMIDDPIKVFHLVNFLFLCQIPKYNRCRLPSPALQNTCNCCIPTRLNHLRCHFSCCLWLTPPKTCFQRLKDRHVRHSQSHSSKFEWYLIIFSLRDSLYSWSEYLIEMGPGRVGD